MTQAKKKAKTTTKKTACKTKKVCKTKETVKADKSAPAFSASVTKNKIVWTINSKVYPMDVVYQAAFIFIDTAYLFLDKDADSNILVQLKGKKELSKKALETLQGEFANELLNQAVRKQVAKQNKKIRELIVAKALFAASRPDELSEIMDGVSSQTQQTEDGTNPVPDSWDDVTEDEQDELDKLLAEIEDELEDDPMAIAVPWDEKYGDKKDDGKKDADKKEEDKK